MQNESPEDTARRNALATATSNYLQEHMGYTDADVKWGKDFDLDESVTEVDTDKLPTWLADLYGKVLGKSSNLGLVMRVLLVVYNTSATSFVPAVPWPRTGLPQFFTLLLSPFTAVVSDDFDTEDVDFGYDFSPALTYVWLAIFGYLGCILLLTLSFDVLAFVIETDSKSSLGRKIGSFVVNKTMEVANWLLKGDGFQLLIRPLMQVWMCSYPPDGGPALLLLEGVKEAEGSELECWSPSYMIDLFLEKGFLSAAMTMLFYVLAIVLSLGIVGSLIQGRLTADLSRASRLAREKKQFQTHIREELRKIHPTHSMLTSNGQRIAMEYCDGMCEGKTWRRSYLALTVWTAIIRVFFSLSADAKAVLVPNLLCNLVSQSRLRQLPRPVLAGSMAGVASLTTPGWEPPTPFV